MTITEWSTVGGSIILAGGTGITIFKKAVIDPLSKKIESLESAKKTDDESIRELIAKIDQKIELYKKDTERKWEENTKEDQRRQEEFIQLRAEHSSNVKLLEGIDSKITKMFEMMEKRTEVEAKLTQEIAVLKQRIDGN